MTEPNPPSRPSPSIRLPVLMGLFAGTTVGGGYLLAGVPNVEVMSLVIALAGAVLGPVRGFVTGALAAAVFSLGSPYGLPSPLLLAGQMAGLGCAGPVGSFLHRVSGQGAGAPARRRWLLAPVGGLVVTVAYDALTNLAILGSFDLPAGVVLAGAVPFFLVHAGSNVAIFALLFPALSLSLPLLARPRVTGRPGLPAVVAVICGLALADACGTAQAQSPAPADAVADTLAAALPPAAADSLVAGVPAADPMPVAAPAAADSATTPAPPTGPNGWRQPLWAPFLPTFLAWAERDSPWLPYLDGGVGAQARLAGEGGAGPLPLVVRDGVPLGTGHALADDAWFVGSEGVAALASGLGADGWGGTDGRVELAARDDDPMRAATSYRGIKGRHESYYRGLDFVSPRADWRLGFTFEESLDNAGYNHSSEPDDVFADRREGGLTGQGKVRQSRTRVERLLPEGGSLSLEFGSGRRTRDDLPTLGAGRLEAWDRNAAVRMRWLTGGWELRPVFFWSERDVQWGARWITPVAPAGVRLLESGRQGLRLDVRRRGAAPGVAAGGVPRLSFAAVGWTLRDTGADEAWAPGAAGAVAGDGGQVRLAAGWDGRLAGAGAEAELGAIGGGGRGLGPDLRLALGEAAVLPRWRAEFSWGGRDPRSDELLTPLRLDVAGRELVLLPEPGLDREQTLRAEVVGRLRLAGLDLALTAAARRLTDGITWRAAADDPDLGRWANDLGLDSWRLAAGVAREGRCLGWARLKAEGTWQGFDVTAGQPGALPPEQWQRLRLDWENHFFREDGILQLSLVTTRRGSGGDPWDVTGTTLLPARVNHDLLVGFRLVGAHLVLGLRNLAGDRQQLTSGALSPGMEMDLRLEWAFHQ